jgi:hypothetical protein
MHRYLRRARLVFITIGIGVATVAIPPLITPGLRHRESAPTVKPFITSSGAAPTSSAPAPTATSTPPATATGRGPAQAGTAARPSRPGNPATAPSCWPFTAWPWPSGPGPGGTWGSPPPCGPWTGPPPGQP